MNTQNDLILISMHSLKAFTSVLRVFFMWLSLRSAGSHGSEGLLRATASKWYFNIFIERRISFCNCMSSYVIR